MSAPDAIAEVTLGIAAPDVTAGELQELRNLLRDELLRLPVDDVLPASGGPAPDGAKAVEALAVGALVVSLGQSSGLFRAVVDTIASWLKRQTIEVEVVVGDQRLKAPVTAAQREALVTAFVERLGQRP
jgi:hypothetical protein